jgi:hypothetical protein
MPRDCKSEDKENVRPTTMLYNKKIPTTASSSRRGFGTLLQEAHNEIIEEMDEKIALQSQCKDIYDMVNKLCVDFEREDDGETDAPLSLSLCL